jgi:hypothetical protein
MDTRPEQVDHDRLRFVFVDMLFALAVAEVATHVSALVKAGQTPFSAPSAWTNLALALCLIAMSWVGWSNSEVMCHIKAATDVFSRSFVVLLTDVLLVIVYYVIAQGVEQPDPTGLVTATAQNESFWCLVVFGLYIFWDFVTKGLGESSQDATRRGVMARFWPRGKISIACFAECAVILGVCLAKTASTANVVFIDLAIIAVVVQFRAMKQGNRRLASCLFLAFIIIGAVPIFL